ncbi:MAG: TauD/TfdA family dioxygenase, partial [Alphaproteobacteria bacterium]
SARSQNAKGHILGHVRDLGRDPNDPTARIYQTTARQTFHTDSTDIVGLICLKTAKSGGESMLVSAMSIYNVMREKAPELALELFQPNAIDRRGEVPVGMKEYYMLPPLTWHDGVLTVHYQRQYINSAQRFEDAPRLTEKRIQALDMFDSLANDPDLKLDMEFRPGDIQLVHNHTLMHDRLGFADWPEPERRRHLLRLWLAAKDARPLPEAFAQRFGSVTIGDRGGVVTAATVEMNAPLEAV